MECELPGFTNPQQPYCQARIAEIKFGSLDQTFIVVSKMGAEQKNDINVTYARDAQGTLLGRVP